MKRHDRESVRAERQRYMQRRRRQFSWWLGGVDYGPMDEHGHRIGWFKQPRPREVREAEFWSGWRVGLFSKWNGNCTHCRKRERLYRNRQERLDRILVRELRDELTA